MSKPQKYIYFLNDFINPISHIEYLKGVKYRVSSEDTNFYYHNEESIGTSMNISKELEDELYTIGEIKR
jgi:hypothetical protein